MPDIDERAVAANTMGTDLADEARYAEAIPHYERALSFAPDWFAVHANLAIACKHTAAWARSLAAALRALELDRERAGDGPLWNAGIAATALGDWPRARWAWTTYGISLPEGDGPIHMDIGMTPIRVSCDENPEVVWCDRIDPARAIIESIPTPESGRRHHDLVLHDGAPRGKRRYHGREVSVFDELALLEPSSFATWRVDIEAPTPDDVEQLFRSVAEQCDAALEDWTGSLEVLCKQCSEGVPHAHGEIAEPTWKPERMLGIATRDEVVFSLIEAWAKAGRGAGEPELLLR